MSEQNTQREAAVQQQQAVAQSRNLNAELQILAKFGGFNVLESSVDGIQNMNPGVQRNAEEGHTTGRKTGRISLRCIGTAYCQAVFRKGHTLGMGRKRTYT